MNPDGVQTVCSKRVMCTKTDDPSGKLCAMRQAVDGAPAFVYNEHNNAHRAWPGTGANSPQRAQCPLRGADTEDTNVTKKKIGVLGAGTWGMALARMLCVSGNDVQVWSALPAEVENLSATRVHPNLPGMKIPEELQFTKSIEEVCTGKDVLLFAVPSVFVRSTTAKARPYIPDGQILVDVAKGMEPDTLYTMTEVIADELNREGGPKGVKLVALSGPTHAEEVAPDMPTTIGKGKSPEQAVKEVGMVVEGINALPAAMELAAKYNVEMPIVQTVNAIVKEGMSASDALRTLMDRNRKNEMPQGYEKV